VGSIIPLKSKLYYDEKTNSAYFLYIDISHY